MSQWFKKLSFGKKILSSYIIFIGISFVLSAIFCLKSIELSKKESFSYMNQFADQVNLNLDVIFSNMDRMRFLHLIDEKVKPMIRNRADQKNITQRLEDEDYITRALNHMTNMNQYVLRATIINEYGDVYSNVRTENSEYLQKMQQIESKQQWDDKHKIYYTGVYNETINVIEYPLVTSISKIYDIDRDTPLGTIYIDLNFKAVEQILDKTLEPQNTGTRLMIFDDEENLVYHTSHDDSLWQGINEEEKAAIVRIVEESGENKHTEMKIQGRNSSVSVMENEETGWKIFVYTPQSDVYAAGLRNLLGMLIAMVFVLTVAIILGILLSRQISRPVRVLIKAMDKVDKGKVRYIDEQEYDWKDEMGYLLRSYNQMGRRINESIEKIYVYQLNQKQTELKMLQFQINPHFLYNTLNTISSIAALEGIDEISRISDNLSNMFQYNIKGRDIVPLKDEIRHVQNYMGIQTIRFPGKYEFTYQMDDNICDEPMLKFILQPLVENALQHAFERMKEINKVSLSCKTDGDDILISIYDNGIGIDEQTLNQLNREFDETDTRTLVNNVDRGIGLRNVNARIKNFYGKGYGIHIESCLDEYTVIHIRIKKIKERNREENDAQNSSCG